MKSGEMKATSEEQNRTPSLLVTFISSLIDLHGSSSGEESAFVMRQRGFESHSVLFRPQ
jgi:hypothetical protein